MHLLKVMLKASGKKGVPQGGVSSKAGRTDLIACSIASTRFSINSRRWVDVAGKSAVHAAEIVSAALVDAVLHSYLLRLLSHLRSDDGSACCCSGRTFSGDADFNGSRRRARINLLAAPPLGAGRREGYRRGAGALSVRARAF
jgi:hypothetical protein